MARRQKNISSTTGKRIRALRVQKNLTQAELADMLFRSDSTVRMWELGKSEPDIATINILADYFGVTVDYLLGNETQKELTVTMDGELEEDVVVFHRDGKNQKRKLTKEQMDMLIGMLNAIPEKPKDL